MTLPSAHPFKFKGQPSTVNNFEFTSAKPPYIWILSKQNGYCYFAFAIKDSWNYSPNRRFSVMPYRCWNKNQLSDWKTNHSKFYGERTYKIFWIDLERIYRAPESRLEHFIDKPVNFDFKILDHLNLLNVSYKKIVDGKAFVFDYATEYAYNAYINAVPYQEIQPFLTQETYDNQIQSFIVKELGKLKVVSPFENDKNQPLFDFIIELKKMAQFNPKNQSN